MYNKKINKRGISAIVATVLIILITVAAVTILWTAIIPMIGDQLESGTVCLDAVTGLELSDAGYTCKNVDANTVSLQIKHGSKAFDLEDVRVLISASGNTQSFDLIAATTITPSGMTKDNLPGANEEKVFVINTAGMTAADIDKIQISPVVLVGNTEKVCDVSATMALRVC